MFRLLLLTRCSKDSENTLVMLNHRLPKYWRHESEANDLFRPTGLITVFRTNRGQSIRYLKHDWSYGNVVMFLTTALTRNKTIKPRAGEMHTQVSHDRSLSPWSWHQWICLLKVLTGEVTPYLFMNWLCSLIIYSYQK